MFDVMFVHNKHIVYFNVKAHCHANHKLTSVKNCNLITLPLTLYELNS